MGARCYTREEVLELLHLNRRTFDRLVKQGRLPFVEAVQPIIPNHKLYRADLIDQYLAGEWGQSRYLNSHKKNAPRATSEVGA